MNIITFIEGRIYFRAVILGCISFSQVYLYITGEDTPMSVNFKLLKHLIKICRQVTIHHQHFKFDLCSSSVSQRGVPGAHLCNTRAKQICSFVELTVKTLRRLPRNVILHRVNKSKQVNHKLMNTLNQTFQIDQETVCSARGRSSEAGGECGLTDCLLSRTQNGRKIWPQTPSCDSSAITSDLTKLLVDSSHRQ